MKDILLITQYTQVPGEFENDRLSIYVESSSKRTFVY